MLYGVCPQHDIIWEGLTAEEHLRLVGQVKMLGACVLAVSRHYFVANSDRKTLESEISRVLHDVGLTDVRKKKASSFSGGMKVLSLNSSTKMVIPDVCFMTRVRSRNPSHSLETIVRWYGTDGTTPNRFPCTCTTASCSLYVRF